MASYYNAPPPPLIAGDAYLSDVYVYDESQINLSYISSTIDSTSTTTGSLILNGGLGIGESLFVGGTITAGAISASDFIEPNFNYPVTFNNTTTFNSVANFNTEVTIHSEVGQALFEVNEADYLLFGSGSNSMNIKSNTHTITNLNFILASSGTLTFAGYQNIYMDSPLTVNSSSTFNIATFNIATFNTVTVNSSSTFNDSTFNTVTFNDQIIVPESGSIPSQGLATLVSGSVTVFNENVASSSRIYLTIQNINGSTVGIQYISNIVPGSFDILSTSSNDNSTVAWLIIQTSNV